jgi:phosphoribosylformylglycinamidine synthase
MNKFWAIEIHKKGVNPEAEVLKHSIADFGIKGLQKLEIIYIYYLYADLNSKEIKEITHNFIFDPVSDDYKIKILEDSRITDNSIEVIYKPGVMDPTAENVMTVLADLGYKNCKIKTAKRYIFTGKLNKKKIKNIAVNLLYNPLIQETRSTDLKITGLADRKVKKEETRVQSIAIIGKSQDELMKISGSRLLALNAKEMQIIAQYYQKLGRNPTDIELETFAQTWSEHCKHKTFAADIVFDDGKKKQIINGLLKSYIKKVTKELNKKWCLSVFEDNSGVVEFDDKYGISFKVETHNHPSALEPYGGAATGIGGVIRDCLGTGLGAKPILNTDVFCFAPPDMPNKKIPQGVLAPKRIIKGVVGGVRDYGNRMGIPTASGAVYFDEGFVANPLVYCGTAGIIPKDKIKKKIVPGDIIVLVGGRTGRDGIHGVTFASLELDSGSKNMSSGAVQIGNPIEEKKVADLMLAARDQNLFNATTDCGGGGLSSAVGELGKCGVIVNLEKVPLKYAGLSYTEIWISEAQERMILFVPLKKLTQFLNLATIHSVEASIIGQVTNTNKLQLRYFGKEVGNIDLKFLHDGLPKMKLDAHIPITVEREVKTANYLQQISGQDYNQTILQLLASCNIASKEWIVRQYDFEVQGHIAIKPFVGKINNGPSDACVLQPIPESKKAVVFSCGLAPQYRKDAYWMAASAIDEAVRNAVAVGGDPDKTAILDNFCWGNPEKPEILAGLVRACQACYDIAKVYGTPFISGKDSLYNEYKSTDGETLSIPSTLLISAVSVIPDLNKTVTMDFKRADELIYLIGKTYPELDAPKVNPRLGIKIFRALHKAIKSGLITACHDLSEGGLAIALAEMSFSGPVGAEINLKQAVTKDRSYDSAILFSESNTRFLVSIPKEIKAKFESLMSNLPYALIGKTTSSDTMKIFGVKNQLIVNLKLKEMEKVWSTSLSSAMQ